jgi:hypothetical protein
LTTANPDPGRSKEEREGGEEKDGMMVLFQLDVCHGRLDHFLDKSVNVVALISNGSVLAKMDQLLLSTVPFSWGVQFEWPQEVRGLLEVRTNSEDFVDEIFHAENVILANNLLDDSVGAKRNSLAVNFTKSTLVDQLSD